MERSCAVQMKLLHGSLSLLLHIYFKNSTSVCHFSKQTTANKMT